MTPYPGSAALVPVLGTAAIIAAADEQVRAWPELCERVGTDATHLRRVRRQADIVKKRLPN